MRDAGPSAAPEGQNGPAEPGGPHKEAERRIAGKGKITFAEFMDIALYWPDGGYYTTGRERWGALGDYVTNIDISPVFALTIAKQVHEMWNCLGSPARFTMVEAGAGRGWLTRGILGCVMERYPAFYDALDARLVEKNPTLREPSAGRVSWHGDISEVGGPITGCLLSNELIDALPVHRVVVRSGRLREIFVGLSGDCFTDVEDEPSTPELAAYFEGLGVELAEGQVAEVNLGARAWVHSAASLVKRGFVLTIDYGLPAAELYGPERMNGTLMCHHRHKINEDPYKNVGMQDITAHVDFTTLVREGAGSGLELTGFTTQKNFLLGLGILDEAAELESLNLENYDKIRYNQSIKELIMPGGPGDTFKVLVQHKGVEKPQLRGFSFRDMGTYLR